MRGLQYLHLYILFHLTVAKQYVCDNLLFGLAIFKLNPGKCDTEVF